MKSALLAQNDNLAIENLKQSVGRSVFNLSHSTTFPIDVDGAILPICCIETVPSDSFEISVECLLRQLSPLKVPIMTNFRLNTAFYYCDNRLAWKKWDRFMTGGRTGNEVYDIPKVANYFEGNSNNNYFNLLDKNEKRGFNNYFGINQNYKNTLHTYLGISLNQEFKISDSENIYGDSTNELPIAIPEFDYQIICRDFYTDIDRLAQNPEDPSTNLFWDFSNPFSDWAYSNLFPVDDDEIRLVDGVQICSGFHSGDDPINIRHGFILDKVRYHNVREDYFTSSKKAPMRGDAPTITTASTSFTLPTGSTFSLGETNFIADPPQSIDSYPSVKAINQNLLQVQSHDINVDTDGKINVDSPLNSQGKLTISSVPALYGQTSGDLVFNSDSTINVTAAELRLLSQLTIWQELNMLHEPYYNDFLNAHFEGVHVGDSPAEKPQYIGGTSQLVSINEILQTSATSESSALGTQGATAMSIANNYVGKYYCNNYGYIIGVAYIIPDMYYEPAMPRAFSRRTKEDFYSPEFANLSMQATLNKEIFFSNDDSWNNTPWGYTGAFDEMRSIPNRIAGDLLNDSYSDLKAWVLRREFDNSNKPSMSTEFLSLKDNVDYTAWQVTNMPKFMLQCANYIKAVRPMPKVAIPKAL